MNISKKVLLLGAGFTKNFDSPLAREIWDLIYNEVESNEIKRNMIYSDKYDFEELLDKFDNKGEIINKIFENIDDNLYYPKLMNVLW